MLSSFELIILIIPGNSSSFFWRQSAFLYHFIWAPGLHITGNATIVVKLTHSILVDEQEKGGWCPRCRQVTASGESARRIWGMLFWSRMEFCTRGCWRVQGHRGRRICYAFSPTTALETLPQEKRLKEPEVFILEKVRHDFCLQVFKGLSYEGGIKLT